MQEIWKSLNGIVENGENYEISNLGNVRSIDRKVNSRNGSRMVRGKMLKNNVDKDGYLYVQFYKHQKQKNHRTHRLVALAFIPNPESKPQVNHKDGIKDNNKLINLEWVTNSENQIHAHITGLKESMKGESHSNTKFTDEKVFEMVNLYKTNKYSMQELADMFNSSISVISGIINGKAWKHLNIKVHKRKSFIITDELIAIVREMSGNGYSKRRIERESGVSRTTVTKILDEY